MKSVTSIIALNGAVFLLMCGVGMIVALLPKQVLDFSGSVAQVGGLASAFAIPYILIQLPIGNLADRYGCKRFLVAGYLLCAVTGVVYFLATSSRIILLGRMVQGIGEAPLWALAPALLSILYPADKGRVMGWYNASLHLGLTSGSLIGVVMSRVWTGGEAFLFFSVMSTLGGLWIWSAVTVDDVKSGSDMSRASIKGFAALCRNRRIACVFCGVVLYGIGYGLFLTVVPAFLMRDKLASPHVIGWYFVLFYIAISLAQLVAGPIADRISRKIPMTGGLLLFAVGMGSFSNVSLSVSLAVLSVSGFGLGVFLVASLAWLNDQVPVEYKGTISGAFYLFWGMGYFFGPMISGVAAQAGKFSAACMILGAISVFVALLVALPYHETSAAR